MRTQRRTPKTATTWVAKIRTSNSKKTNRTKTLNSFCSKGPARVCATLGTNTLRKEHDAQLARLRDIQVKTEARVTQAQEDRDGQVGELRRIMDIRQNDFLARTATIMSEADETVDT